MKIKEYNKKKKGVIVVKKGEFVINIPKKYTYQEYKPCTKEVEEYFNISGWLVKKIKMCECPLTQDLLIIETYQNEKGEFFHVYKRNKPTTNRESLHIVTCSLKSFELDEFISISHKKRIQRILVTS